MARSRRPTARLPCGCVYFTDREEWAELCPADKAETEERHARAQIEYRRGPTMPSKPEASDGTQSVSPASQAA